MNKDLKQQVAEAAIEYCNTNNLSQEDIAGMAGINLAYINGMFTGKHTHKAGKNKVLDIKDKYYISLAKTIGFALEKQYWNTVETSQYIDIRAALASAKVTGRTAMIIGDTGTGKTYTIDEFCQNYPTGTIRLTMSSLYTLNDVLNELCDKLKVPAKGSKLSKLQKIAGALKKMQLNKEKPIVILDEAENMGVSLLKMIKGLYDAIKGVCAIVLVGTSELTDKLDRMKEKGKPGMPQFCRRFKAGTIELKDIKQEALKSFLKELGINDADLISLLVELADNFGELNDYLEPALIEADKKGVELDVELFRLIYNLK